MMRTTLAALIRHTQSAEGVPETRAKRGNPRCIHSNLIYGCALVADFHGERSTGENHTGLFDLIAEEQEERSDNACDPGSKPLDEQLDDPWIADSREKKADPYTICSKSGLQNALL